MAHERRESQLTNFVTTKGIDNWVSKSSKITEQKVSAMLESSSVAYCKVNTLQEMFPDFKEFLSPLYPHEPVENKDKNE